MAEKNQSESSSKPCDKPKITCPFCDYDGDIAQVAKHLELSSTARELAWIVARMLSDRLLDDRLGKD